MGRDYFTWHETHILFTDVSGMEVKFVLKEDEKQGHYAYHRSYDSDFEDAPPHNQPLMVDIASYGTKWLYDKNLQTVYNGWMCKPSGKTRIENVIKVYNLQVGTLNKVYKVLNGYWCDYSQKDWFDGLQKGFEGMLIVKDVANELLYEDDSDEESIGSE